MYKYTVMMIAAVVVVLASVPATSAQAAANKFNPMSAAATSVHSKHVKNENRQIFASEAYNEQSNNVGSQLLSGLLEAISIPKKIASALISKVSDLLKSVDLRKLIKIALIGGAVIVLGAVAAAGVAGIAAVVALVSAALPYFRFFFGGHKGEASESEIDVISEFVLNAFNKYDSQHKA
ncbi:uncharacterized protein LOC111033875 [Myzus persicae]|uniref:uncharacterized protein LOC111033875 n=1 Tax=Myzus persicae TaxID=13164 RepID=UPI000B935229|nr:uncharacterized protein LOC111033875 [Myzus persicae]